MLTVDSFEFQSDMTEVLKCRIKNDAKSWHVRIIKASVLIKGGPKQAS